MNISSVTHPNTATCPTYDGVNQIHVIADDDNYIGMCYTYKINGVAVEADIALNVKYNWSIGAQNNCYDYQTIFLHETGHAAGLADVYDADAQNDVMYGYAYPNMTKRSLSDDDKAGIEAIYGS